MKRRLIFSAAALAALATVTTTAASAAPARPPVTKLVTTPCMTYEDGSGLCGRAHWEPGSFDQDGRFSPGDWIFDTITERFCVRGAACETNTPPALWGDR